MVPHMLEPQYASPAVGNGTLLTIGAASDELVDNFGKELALAIPTTNKHRVATRATLRKD
jgi:hypothetical protein